MFIDKNAGLALGIASFLFAGHAVADDSCPKPVTPVVNVDLPSRYKDDDRSRSELDETLNAEVEKALAPIDAFIRDLASTANATTNEKKAEAAADCNFQ